VGRAAPVLARYEPPGLGRVGNGDRMSEKFCPKCRSRVDPQASICRYCRSKLPTAARTLQHGIGIAAVSVIVLLIVYHGSDPSPTGTANSQTSDAAWLAQNENDPKALDDKFGIGAQTACSIGADDYLRSQAAHDFAWDNDAQGFLGTKFDKISTLSAGPGLLTLVTTRAKLSNAFGGFEHFEFYCLYDVRADKVVKYSLDDPGFKNIPLPDNAADLMTEAPEAQNRAQEANQASAAPAPVTEAGMDPSELQPDDNGAAALEVMPADGDSPSTGGSLQAPSEPGPP